MDVTLARRRSALTVLVGTLVLAASLLLSGCASEPAAPDPAASADGYTTVKEGTLTVVSDLANPPFDYMEDGVAKGFEVELMQELAQKMGLECEFLPPLKFDSIIPTIQQGGKADVGASNFTITDERRQEIDFTDAYIDSNQGIVTSAQLADSVSADVSALDDATSSIAVQAGTTGESWARENLPRATVVALDDPIQALTGVQTGLYAAAIADLPVMRYECLNAYTDLKVAREIATGEQYGIVVSKANPGLTSALDAALASCREDGTLSTLEAKWFGESEESGAPTPAATSTSQPSPATGAAGGAGTIEVQKATARPNESGGSGVIGAMNTRLTWEGTVNVDGGISSVTLSLPEGSTFEGSTTRVTVLDGLNRLNVDGDAKASGSSVTVSFAAPVPAGSLLRLEVTDMQFPAEGGAYVVGGSYTTAAGTEAKLEDSPSISVIANTPVQQVVNWLDGQGWVAAWNSVPFLGMFFKPQLLVTSFVSLFGGWLVCLGIVIVAYPFAILLGLLFAIMKISGVRLARGVAAVYINVLRGTPLFLQIYIMFFGLPMMGINIDNNVLGVMVMAINSSAYLAEIFRAGIQSIPQGQYEAAASLGMNRAQTMLSIILPQTVRRVIPTVTSDFITSYKDTSLLSSVGVMELMMFSKNLTTVSGNITPYMAAAIYYLIVTLPLIRIVSLVERRLANAERGGGTRPKAASASGRGASHTVGEKTASSYHAQGRDASWESGMHGALDVLTGPFRTHPASSEV
ncbi:polar amino acid ABC transporter, inner membrane subunit [Olsenella uli DSM 7084]|uniref:Polar amino acid ABC transporter, inner membrane subunit n=1 Tax=Olsenella uli (strain ATCC 49627 / DSM 7084 / CCUG 31166 / CIP 109912 / JCM 12494 / LMG 11480 / NCIMB 702895 / VPI D76D-27C) TaxID=633147 RepID=E1QWE8_OLSUV|nr:ABC transporter substrate-binding protein/permease [Olsenella uli]ADK68451.1 polar amino acid ABC transporter, inner membrane subunit [Olsenella uli DSM 7084]